MIFISLSVQAQTPDTAAISEASALYQPKSLKGGVAISATAPLVPIQKLDNKLQWVRSLMQGQIDGVNAVLPLKLNSSTAASTYATISSVNSKVNTSAFLDSLTASRNNINYVASNSDAVYAKKSEISVGSGTVYYVDNSKWKANGGTRTGAIYLAQKASAQRGSVLYPYPTIWEARNAAVKDSATVTDPVIHVLGGTHIVGIDTASSSNTFDYAVPLLARSKIYYPDTIASALNYKRLSYRGDEGTSIRVLHSGVRVLAEGGRIDSFFFKNISIKAVSGYAIQMIGSSLDYESPYDSLAQEGNYTYFFPGSGQSKISIKSLKANVGYIVAYNGVQNTEYGRLRPSVSMDFENIYADSINQNHNLFLFAFSTRTKYSYKVNNFIASGSDMGIAQIGWYPTSSWARFDSLQVSISVNRFFQRRKVTSASFTQGLFMFSSPNANVVGSRFAFDVNDVECEMPLFGNSNIGATNMNKDTVYIGIKKGLFAKGTGSIGIFCGLEAVDSASVIVISGNYEIKDFSGGINLPSGFKGKLILDNCYIKANNNIPLITNNSSTGKVILRNTTLVVGGAASVNSIQGTGSIIVESARSNTAVAGTITQQGGTVSVNTAFNY